MLEAVLRGRVRGLPRTLPRKIALFQQQRIKRVGWQRGRPGAAAHLQTQGLGGRAVVLGNDHHALVRVLKSEQISKGAAGGQALSARPHVVAQVFQQIIFVVELVRFGRFVHRHQRVLAPAPAADAAFFERSIPVEVGVGAIGEVLL